MGGTISNIRKKGDVNDEEERIKKYEEATENDRYGFAFENEDDREIKWWQYLIYDIRFRIAYALAIAIFVGVIIPIIVYFVYFDKDDKTIYGSCLINENARFQCLINNFEPVNEAACVDAYCCWEENDELQFKCFHSFPSAYQYHAVSELKSLQNDNQTDFSRQNVDAGVQLEIQPNHADRMSALKIQMSWIDENHLNLQMFNPKDYPEIGWTGNKSTSRGELNAYGVIVDYGEQNDYFFIRIGRNNSQEETIFDTRLGPINSGDGFISFTTTLPTPYFYGLRGGQGIASRGTLTYGVVNGYSSAELPFYMSQEKSGLWHGVLLDTINPFIVQVVQAPGILFHIEGSAPKINLQIFTGSSKEQVLQQLHKHITTTEQITTAPYVPPYFGFGVNLCPKFQNGTQALEHIMQLDNDLIPYDSFCIDGSEKFDNLDEIVDFLINKAKKKIVLTQNMGLKWNETEISAIQEILVKDKTNTSNIHPYTGVIDNQTVYYLDVFHPNFTQSLTELGLLDFMNIPFSGLILGDNFPKNENATSTCKTPGSFLQNILISGSSIANSEQNGTWGSMCPNMVHTIGEGREKAHLEVHNSYGLEAMKKLREIGLGEMKIQARENESFLLSTSSGWTSALYYGGHNGMEVPFTWIGLRESLAHTLRQFVLSPFPSIPICGSSSADDTLSLRCYQLGLLLPFAYNSYGHGNVSRGPLDFPQSYKVYLISSIRQRYSYAPYYYTISQMYKRTLVPPISPMSYLFNDVAQRQTVFGLVDQFMIGEALLAAPIITTSLNRETYFPAGIWYDIDGLVAWTDTMNSGFKTVTGHITQAPLFVRAGYIIPTLQNPQGNSILESRQGNYTVLIGLLPNNVSKGMLYIDDGIHSNSLTDEISFEMTNVLNDAEITLNFTMTSTNLICNLIDSTISTRVDQIKILGFPMIFNNITFATNSGPSIPCSNCLQDDEMDMLRIYNLNLDWCKESNIHVTISAFTDNKS